MKRQEVAERRRRAEKMRGELVAAITATAVAIEREQQKLRRDLGQHATPDAINHRIREMRATAVAPFEAPARELLEPAAEIEAHAKGLRDRERLLRPRPAPFEMPTIPEFVDTTDGVRIFLAMARVLHDTMAAMSFQMSLPRYTADELQAVATDASASRDYGAFAAVRRELRARGSRPAGGEVARLTGTLMTTGQRRRSSPRSVSNDSIPAPSSSAAVSASVQASITARSSRHASTNACVSGGNGPAAAASSAAWSATAWRRRSTCHITTDAGSSRG